MPPGPWLCLALLLAARAQSSWGPWPIRARPWWPRDLSISISSARYPRSYHHLEGDVRWRRLYSSTHFFLHIGSSGRVEGTRQPHCPNSIVEIRSVRVGVVAIKAVYTGFYLAMNRRGKLYGTREYSPNCKFMERIEENGYNTYASLRWRHEGRQMFLALDGRGAPRQGGRTRRQHLSTHFLPILVS